MAVAARQALVPLGGPTDGVPPLPGPGKEADFKSEQAGLKAYGVDLADNHLDGYIYKPDRFKVDEKEMPKPWEVSLKDQFESLLGPDKAYLCDKPEAWTNEEFLLEIRDGIAYCTMNRPAANNALNDGLNAGLHDAIRILRGRPDIRIAVLTGNGRMFCAGGDPKAFQAAQAAAGAIESAEGEQQAPAVPEGGLIAAAGEAINAHTSKKGKEAAAANLAHTFYGWATLPQFTIALMNGSAMGGGVGLVCCSDMAVAVKSAHVTLSEVKLGVIPAVISPHVIRTIGSANAKKLFVTAENCTMQQAKTYGMVQRIVNDASEFPAVVKEISQKIRGCAPGALAATKKCALNCLNQPLSEALIGYTAQEYVRARTGEECEDGMKALASRTKPKWIDSPIDIKET